MAIRAKRNGFEVYYRDPATGKQRSRFFKNRKDAEKEDRRVKYLLEFDRVKILEEDADRTIVPPEAEAKPYTLADAAKDWCRWHNRSKCPDPLPIVVKRFGTLEVAKITTKTLSQCVLSLQQQGLAQTTVARRLVGIMTLLHTAETMGVIQQAPKRPKIVKGISEQFVPPNEEELSKLYDAAPDSLKRVIVLGAYFGMRVGPCELTSLKWSDIDFDNWIIRLRAAKKNHSEPVRVLPIPVQFRDLFSAWYRADGCNADKNVTVSHNSLSKSWLKLLEKADITRRIRPYDLRHAFATNALRRGIDIGTVAKLMGHTDISMIAQYYQYVGDQDKLKALEKLGCCMDSPAGTPEQPVSN